MGTGHRSTICAEILQLRISVHVVAMPEAVQRSPALPKAKGAEASLDRSMETGSWSVRRWNLPRLPSTRGERQSEARLSWPQRLREVLN